MMLIAQNNKDNKRKKVTPEEEYLTGEVEVEEEANRMYINVINVGSWVTNILSALRMKREDKEMHM